ncbi:6-phosphofructokinase [Litorilinea aerophila]|uniref:6-phosphofructokinase n=1 Tax=Litorilinea aerophila TaxID=1204385 RepID=A0A540VBB0_9CHLR|nr:6-phosphofructokinase [Litorilinea aerophila]MCC9078174.1 6-phosphofructokinase [Litorilinea aerophila]GIV76836.1 MAG: 6-phosphofructokinase [Litorilinea sp.]
MDTRLGVLTSGGDAPGMNAAVRAVVRAGLDRGADVYAIYDGYHGLIEGESHIRKMGWNDVGGILHRGGTIIGTARSEEFRTLEGRRRAVRNLLRHGIDRLVVIGGDGSLTGANLLRQEWADHLQALVASGEIPQEIAARHPFLAIAGLVGSIDNDMHGTDMTIGADSALHRITAAVDAIASTAASHQRTFVVEVMGRRCGYLALMSGIATGAEWVLIPENPPDMDNWEERMCQVLREGMRMGRRDNIVIVAEGAQDRHGNPITSEYVRRVLEERLGEEVRVTVLGHVQRGGPPSAFDRILSTLTGVAAVETVLEATAESEAYLIGIHENKIVRQPLMECVAKTHAINAAMAAQDFETAMAMRGRTFQESFRIMRTLVRAMPHPPTPGQRRIRFAILHAGGPAPGMNAAVRAAVRLSVDRGHLPVGVQRGFRGLIQGHLEEMGWMSVNGWAPVGGAELGTSRKVPGGSDLYAIARNLEEHQIDALMIIGGWAGYQAALRLYQERENYPAFNIPIVCIPATINNNLPGSELSIGADTALNSIVEVVDKIKQSAVASNRCFVVEVMGRYCGYLALMSALATGAERVYLHEEGIRLADLEADIAQLIRGFQHGKRLGLMIRNENANPLYTTSFLAALFEEEGGDLFDVRIAVLGHLQQGGSPTPFDRTLAARLAARGVEFLEESFATHHAEAPAVCLGLQHGAMQVTPLEQIPRLMDERYQRPREQWWMSLRPIASMLAKPDPYFQPESRPASHEE